MTYRVVKNDKKQYSIWPSEETLPNGWTVMGFQGRKVECIAKIEKLWFEMRPNRGRPL